jgi:hypothetical protein
MIRLMTSFNGKPAIGGLFDPTTAIFYKACRSLSGGQHPHRPDLGGLDSPVVERLIAFRCEKIVLEIPGASYEIPFERFLENGYPQKWNDTRFPHARWYCQARHWNSEHLVRLETPYTEEQTKTEQKQASLFEPTELQNIAGNERGWRI